MGNQGSINLPTDDHIMKMIMDAPAKIDLIKKDATEKLKKNMENGFNPSYLDDQGNTLLTLACLSGSETQANMFINMLKSEDLRVGHVNGMGATALELALIGKMNKTCVLLIDKYGEECNFDHVAPNGCTAFSLALQLSNLDIANKLHKEYKCKYNKASSDGSTPLYYACKFKDPQLSIEITEKLGNEFKPDVVCKTHNESLLAVACRGKKKKVINKLLEYDNCFPGMKSNKNDTPLLWLCYHNMPDEAIKLLNKFGTKCNIDVVDHDSDGHTSLMYACKFNMVEVVKKLLELGCNTSYASPRYGVTAFEISCIEGNDTTDILLEHGDLNLDHVNENGLDALLHCFAQKKYKTAKKLINKQDTVKKERLDYYTAATSIILKDDEEELALMVVEKYLTPEYALSLLNICSRQHKKVINKILNKVAVYTTEKMVELEVIERKDKNYQNLINAYKKTIGLNVATPDMSIDI